MTLTPLHRAFVFLTSGLIAGCSGGPEYRIAYNVLVNPGEGQNYEVFSMRPDGSDKRNITKNPDVAWVYHADGPTVFFISDRDTCTRCYFLYEMDAFGNNVRKVTDLQLEDSWMGSRNGGGELVVSGRVGNELRYQLFLVDRTTGGFSRITTDTSGLYRDPTFSPDGKQIVYAFRPDKRDRRQHEELYIMNADGTEPRRLTTYPEAEANAERQVYYAGPPRWNAAENFITYQSFQQGKYSLFAVTPDGTRQWKLTSFTEQEGWHSWSPDGRSLVVEVFDGAQQEFDVMRVDYPSMQRTMLTDASVRYEQAPVFVQTK